MDINQLKLILESFATMGQEAKPLAILWLCLAYTVPYSTGFLFLLVLYKTGVRLFHFSQCIMAFREFRDLLGIGSHGELVSAEIEATRRKIRSLIREKQKRQEIAQ